MRFTTAIVVASAASPAVAATVSTSGKHRIISGPLSTETVPLAHHSPIPQSLDSTSTKHSGPFLEPQVIIETQLVQPTEQAPSGGYKTIACGCSYKYPHGFIECPFSGSTAPPGFCSYETITITKSAQTHLHTNLAKSMGGANMDPRDDSANRLPRGIESQVSGSADPQSIVQSAPALATDPVNNAVNLDYALGTNYLLAPTAAMLPSAIYWNSVLTSAVAEVSALEASLSKPSQAAEAPDSTITSAPVLPARQDHDVFWTIEQLVSTILSAKSAMDYYSWLAQSISMGMYEATVTFVNTACGNAGGIERCTTETLFFATQNSPHPPVAARAEATSTGSVSEETSIITNSQPIATVTKIVTASTVIQAPSNDTSCTTSTTSSTTPILTTGSLCSYENGTLANATTMSFQYNTTSSSLSAVTGLPITASNLTSVYSRSTMTITTLVNGTTATPNTTVPESTTMPLGGTSAADGGKQVVLATVGMAFFAILAFFL